MNEIVTAITRLFGHVVFWIIVQPWEQCLRVRLGRHVRVLAPGFYWRIPIIDAVFKQSVRQRTAMIPTQTLSTADGATVIVGATLAYEIGDIRRLYERLHHAEDTIQQLAAAAVASFVLGEERVDVNSETLSQHVSPLLNAAFEPFGFVGVEVRVTDLAFVRAYRLVSDKRWGGGSDTLDTQGGAK